jgi:hypothetical protein
MGQCWYFFLVENHCTGSAVWEGACHDANLHVQPKIWDECDAINIQKLAWLTVCFRGKSS